MAQVIRVVVITVVCLGLFLILETLMLPKATALRINGFRLEEQRPHKRRHYMWQRGRNKEVLRSLRSLERNGMNYETEMDAAEQLPVYSEFDNMIDDENFFGDRSVETKTNINYSDKRADMTANRINNQAFPDLPCSCGYIERTRELSEEVFPKKLNERVCRQTENSDCANCVEVLLNVPILKHLKNRKSDESIPQNSSDITPNNLRSWYAGSINLPVGCRCERAFVTNQK